MNKTLLIAVTALALASCTDKKNPASKTEQGEQPAQEATVTLNGIDFKAPEYLSPDLAMQDLGGRVKTMDYTAYECNPEGYRYEDAETISYNFGFNEQGMLTKGFAMSETDKGVKVTRDKDGHITQTERTLAGATGIIYTHQYTYNDRGNIATEVEEAKESSTKTTNIYTDGVLTSSKVEAVAEGKKYSTTNTLTILEADAHGNWTKRLCASTIKIGPNDGSGRFDDSQMCYNIEERKIVYY